MYLLKLLSNYFRPNRPSDRRLLLELMRMSAVLDGKVRTISGTADQILASSTKVGILVADLTAQIAAGSVDNPATLTQLDTIQANLTQAASILTAALPPTAPATQAKPEG